ncbi:hypothetical protein [Natronorubrum halophilum]|uniref:hypothetical protein n=1 Tax=Natronorubrum halophilum TaxID=1702106 RepID=UPI0010C1D79A|nr:hypothetical protein [Natronorubrum halophilum]
MKPKFEATEDGIEIIDPIERRRYRLTTHEPVSPEPVDTDRIQFPIDSAAKVKADMITLPTTGTIYIRKKDGSMIEVQPNDHLSLLRSEYTLDLSGPLKLYAHLKSSVQIYSDTEHTYITLDDSTFITLGARSYHRRPAGTITTTSEPGDIMQAVSAFGSALKTITPERSYPTLRGHPPTIELGNQLNIPERFVSPETEVQIEVPQTLRHVFVTAPLAYYLGAEIIPGTTPRLIIGPDYSYDLNQENSFEETIEQILKHIFFLDCIVRTEGTTPLPLYEREKIEPELNYNIENLYKQPLTEQLRTYLEGISLSTVKPHLPKWRLETYLQPNSKMSEFLPFIVDRLSIIKVKEENEKSASSIPEQTQAIEEFVRNDTSTCRTEAESEANERGSTVTIRQFWKKSKFKQITSTTPLSAFHNSIGRNPRADPIEIKVICNDEDMIEELDEINKIYGSRKEIPFSVTAYHNISTCDLKQVLKHETDFLHYMGHVDENGLGCSDGKLDVSQTSDVGAKAFLLNACQSYEQGVSLIEAGSIGGIVTLDDVVNSGAVKVGSTIAQLLNRGYPLYAALEISREKNIVGKQYHLVGDGITTIAQSKMGSPNVCTVTNDKCGLKLEMSTYRTVKTGKGGLFTPCLDSIESYYLTPGRTDQIPVTEAQLQELFDMDNIPISFNSDIEWSDNIALEKLL